MLTNAIHHHFVDTNKMQINQVLQIKKSPTPRQWNGGHSTHNRSMYHNQY